MYVKRLKYGSYESLKEEIDRVIDSQIILDILEDTISDCRDTILNAYQKEYQNKIHLPDTDFANFKFWLEVYYQFLDNLYWTEYVKEENDV